MSKAGIAEFDNLTSIYIDQVIVMRGLRKLVTGSPITEAMSNECPKRCQELYSSIDGCNAEVGVDELGTTMNFLNVGMVARLADDVDDDFALAGGATAS